MTFAVSPGVSIREFDLTTTVPAIAETPAAFSGLFRWGPVLTRILISSEDQLVRMFGKPSNLNGETWFTLSSFLAYGGFSWLVRTGDTHGNTTVAQFTSNVANVFSTINGNPVVQISNTTGINVGDVLFYVNNAFAIDVNQEGGVTVVQRNASSVTLSSAPTGNVANIQFIFRTNIMYSAVAMEVVDYINQWADQVVLNPHDYTIKDGSFDQEILYMSRYPGALGNSLRVAVCDAPTQFNSNSDLSPVSMHIPTSNLTATNTSTYFDLTQCFITANVFSNVLSVVVAPANTANAAMVVAANQVAGLAHDTLTLGDLILMGNDSIGFQHMKVTGIANVTSFNNVFSFSLNTQNPYRLHANSQQEILQRYWEFYNYVQTAPGQSDWVYAQGNNQANDELHVVIVDDGGQFTGVPTSILEVYRALSRATDAKNLNNTTNYYKDVINQQSHYVWWTEDRSTALSATAPFIQSSTSTAPLNLNFQFGADGLDEDKIGMGIIIDGYLPYISAEDVDISLIMTGKGKGLPISSNTQLATWLIQNIAERRKDCIVLASPDIGLVVNNQGFEALDIADARDSMPSTSYGVLDSGYKYMYDRYNDLYRWVPLNGDIAGLCAQTDQTNAPWWSPAGFNRGNIKNVVRLAWNPNEGDRDILYSNDINPCVHFRDMGTILYGDKTLFHKPSAFNRINVRRLFIVLEKAIATAAKFFLFEFNDEFTRSQFKAMVNPFLKQVQGQRGITGFLVRCDQTNNTPWIIQNNQFVADIFIRPNYSINWIMLNFVNVPPTLSFAEAEAVQF